MTDWYAQQELFRISRDRTYRAAFAVLDVLVVPVENEAAGWYLVRGEHGVVHVRIEVDALRGEVSHPAHQRNSRKIHGKGEIEAPTLHAYASASFLADVAVSSPRKLLFSLCN